MALKGKYWREDKNAPFAILLGTIEAHCHPEAYDEAYEDLIQRARHPEGDAGINDFKEQLRTALQDTSKLPEDALFTAAQYSDGSDDRFLSRLWRDLYPNEPLPAS